MILSVFAFPSVLNSNNSITAGHVRILQMYSVAKQRVDLC